jgi:hypothetical protein
VIGAGCLLGRVLRARRVVASHATCAAYPCHVYGRGGAASCGPNVADIEKHLQSEFGDRSPLLPLKCVVLEQKARADTQQQGVTVTGEQLQLQRIEEESGARN